jgi:hypothetical protein
MVTLKDGVENLVNRFFKKGGSHAEAVLLFHYAGALLGVGG